MQLQYVQLILDKTNATDLSSGVFAILISVTRTKKYKVDYRSTGFVEWKTKEALKCSLLPKLYRADSTADAFSFIRRIVLWSETSSPQIQLQIRPDVSS